MGIRYWIMLLLHLLPLSNAFKCYIGDRSPSDRKVRAHGDQLRYLQYSKICAEGSHCVILYRAAGANVLDCVGLVEYMYGHEWYKKCMSMGPNSYCECCSDDEKIPLVNTTMTTTPTSHPTTTSTVTTTTTVAPSPETATDETSTVTEPTTVPSETSTPDLATSTVASTTEATTSYPSTETTPAATSTNDLNRINQSLSANAFSLFLSLGAIAATVVAQ
ncbi:hypothetical protein PMAYCL1PPCAC_09009 [Pristionchus mayeri]|uniref:Uncharacterized protein n=1 Tax=Pristionchus mayeri TaxID=1317129 RepID=A0AAN4ZF62_9BILA|nr:hypothetical protein PMAYCL1PPCAC_09009 [Pristionchus mayeri]